ncbi:siroheme synthase [Pseudooceanicola sp. 216_PA32_1]|uniref:precorrin-2 dehydrogenase n=1 Tax=Pseudooceanicola pacificus TaxID=2676438 RepID=A0A844W6Z2_9RHOB|nr:NAD(P)-dependent oxidoreductase [Pseudooceanicola pacificus]MWB78601.1 siroheme synthase [Pseudooceanicola pacificus]
MRHFPVFMNMEHARVVLSGGGDAALAKLRLLLKTPARIEVYAEAPAPEIETWQGEGLVHLYRRALRGGDLPGATLAYAADEDAARDARTAALARAVGVPINIVDNLHDSGFITPAIVDRSPVCVAIGTEGAAPVLARSIKAEIEERLPASLGVLTRAAQGFRKAAEALPFGGPRRAFWAEYFDRAGPEAYRAEGEVGLGLALTGLLDRHLAQTPSEGRITLAWTGSDDPDLLTLKTRKALDAADVVVHDADIAPAVLELARREARFVALERPTDVPPMPRLLNAQTGGGAHVLYLSARPLPDRLEQGCRAAGMDVTVIPGVADPARPAAAALKETA